MRQWMEGMRWRMQTWMQGRYGQDALSRSGSYAALILIIVSFFLRGQASRIVVIVAFAVWAWSLFRMFSKNGEKRYRELQTYEKLIAKPRGFFQFQRRRFQDRKTHCYFKCPCGQTLRVPKGRGKLEITCPKCKTSMIRRT